VKLGIHAAIAASIVLSLVPFELGGARSLTQHSHSGRSISRAANPSAKAPAKAPAKRIIAVKKTNKKAKKVALMYTSLAARWL